MKAFEFKACVSSEGALQVPADLREQMRPDEPVRVLLLVPDRESDAEWNQLTTTQFLQGYDASDAIYDNIQSK